MRSPGHSLPAFFCLFSIALILPSLAHAGINRWTSIGPDANELFNVRAIAVDPTSARTVYVGGGNAVFRTSDGGASWNYSQLSTSVVAVAVDPSTPSTVYAGGLCGMWKSIDAGATWMAIDRGLTDVCIYALAIDPTNPAILYAGSSTDGVYKSANGGASWSKMNSGLPRNYWGLIVVSTLVVDPLNPSTVYAAAGGFFKSTNGGSTWTATAELRVPSEPTPLSVDSLVIDPSASSTLYAGNRGYGIFKSTDGAASWQQLPRPAGYPAGYAYNIAALAIDPVSPRTVYAAMDYNNPYFGVLRTVDGGQTWTFLNVGLPATGLYPKALAVSPSSPSTLYTGTAGLYGPSLGGTLWEFTLLEPCAANATTLCLNDSRFRVEVSWHAANLDTAGPGQAVPLTSDTGHFWFFSSNNIELVVKVVDGRAFNNHFWVFYGALSDVEYTITVTDTQTGAVKPYFNPQGHLASVADTAAFAATGGGAPPVTTGHTSLATAGETVSCSGDPTTLCLNASRFRVQVSWRAVNLGTSGQGQAMSLTADTGYFWFFSSNNLELVIKVVDGRAFNDHFWVFYGALSDVEYTVTVTDTETGAARTYVNPQGRLASVADTAAF